MGFWADQSREVDSHPPPKELDSVADYILGLISVKLQATLFGVRIRNFVHKGLKRFYMEDSVKGVPPDTVDKLRKMLAFLDDMHDPEELRALATWKAHTLTGAQGYMEP